MSARRESESGPLGAVIVAIGIYDMADVSRMGGELLGEEISPSIGWGLWIVILSGAAALACPFASRFERSKQVATAGGGDAR